MYNDHSFFIILDSLSLIEDEVPNHIPDDLGGQFTEIFIKNSENVTLLLSLLEVSNTNEGMIFPHLLFINELYVCMYVYI